VLYILLRYTDSDYSFGIFKLELFFFDFSFDVKKTFPYTKGGYQRSNQNPYIEEEYTTQWPKEKG
jgi:hypothetical protein